MSVTVYVADGCRHCQALLEDLRRRRVSHVAVNLTALPGDARVEEADRLVAVAGAAAARVAGA